jgi:hypothetical protein
MLAESPRLMVEVTFKEELSSTMNFHSVPSTPYPCGNYINFVSDGDTIVIPLDSILYYRVMKE